MPSKPRAKRPRTTSQKPSRRPTVRAARGRAPLPGTSGLLSVRDNILDRTIHLIGKNGTTDVSVREIAREAGVNVAAVNYYFSSKDQMFAEMAARFLTGYLEVMRLLEEPEKSPEERLRRWSEVVMGHLASYPGLLSLMERLMTTEPRDPFGKALREGMERALARVRQALDECFGPAEEERQAFKMTMLTSALAGPFPHMTGRVTGRRRGLQEPAARARFIELLIEHLRH